MKKWIFITTCTVVVLLSTVNVYRVLGDWNTPFLSMLKLEQLAYGEGGNAGGEGGGSVNDCDIFIEDIWKLGVSMKYHQILMQVLI